MHFLPLTLRQYGEHIMWIHYLILALVASVFTLPDSLVVQEYSGYVAGGILWYMVMTIIVNLTTAYINEQPT